MNTGEVTGEGAGRRIQIELATWPGVTAEPHRFGGIEYRYGRKEMGHVHGDRLADLPFPRQIHDELIAAGRVELHHVLPDTGWSAAGSRLPMRPRT